MNPVTNCHTEPDIVVAIREFIRKQFPRARKHPLHPGDPLLESGIIDSMGVLELVDFIENRFGVIFSDEELLSDTFSSIQTLSKFVLTKRNGEM